MERAAIKKSTKQENIFDSASRGLRSKIKIFAAFWKTVSLNNQFKSFYEEHGNGSFKFASLICT